MSRSAVPSPLLTAADLERLSLPDKQVELIRGRLVVGEPPGAWHGAIAATLTYHLGAFVRARHSGTIFAQDTGFHIGHDPDTVRAPDVAFVARERLSEIPRTGYAPVAPDLAVEILSPGDRPGETLAKLADWLGAGSRLVWLVDPRRAEVHVYRRDGTLSVVGAEGALDGEDVLPGFTCPVRQLFDW